MNKMLGYDFWKSHLTIYAICSLAIQNEITVYDILVDTHCVCFYTPIYQRKKIYHNFEQTSLVHTTGIFGFLLRHYKNPISYLRIICIICIYSLLQQFTFTYYIQGTDGVIKSSIEKQVKELGFPYYGLHEDDVFNQIVKEFDQNLSWLEVEREGSKLIISFSEKKNVTISQLTREPLFATKDAVIVSFDVQHGYKKVNVHDFVYKGSVLVDSYMLDSNGNSKELFVKGKVYGYTWYTITSTMKSDDSLHRSITFFRLLFDCRNQISMYLDKNEAIVKETILQYTQDEGTILLKVHYTLLEDITVP